MELSLRGKVALVTGAGANPDETVFRENLGPTLRTAGWTSSFHSLAVGRQQGSGLLDVRRGALMSGSAERLALSL